MTGSHRAPSGEGGRRAGARRRWVDGDWLAENYLWFVWPVIALLTGLTIGFFFMALTGAVTNEDPFPNPPPRRSTP